MTQTLRHHPLTAAIALAVAMTGCATNPDGTMKLDTSAIKLDNKTTSALIGAAAGCALGAAVKGTKGCVAGAVAGAAAGFLLGWYFESKKLADAAQVNAEYGKKKAGVPKDDVIPAKFESNMNTTADSSGHKEVEITSNTDLIGYGDKVPNLQQKFALYDENNQLVEEKTEKITAVDGAGRYQTTSKFKLPEQAKGKRYTVKTMLVSNDKTYKEKAYKVSLMPTGFMVASL